MSLDLVDLDARTREMMATEFTRDETSGSLYVSPRLSETGREIYGRLLREAIESGDDATLAEALRSDGAISQTEQARKPKGGFTTKRVPVTAATTLAEGEFNRFYLRGLCVRALEEGQAHLVIYRARASAAPRPESLALERTQIAAAALLDDLREHPGVDTALGLPPGPNSGLSARLPAP